MLPSYVIGLLALLFLGFADSRLEARERFIETKNINWQNISFSGLYTEFTETDTNDVYKIHIRIQNSEVLYLIKINNKTYSHKKDINSMNSRTVNLSGEIKSDYDSETGDGSSTPVYSVNFYPKQLRARVGASDGFLVDISFLCDLGNGNFKPCEKTEKMVTDTTGWTLPYPKKVFLSSYVRGVFEKWQPKSVKNSTTMKNKGSFKERLENIKQLLNDGLISPDEAQSKRESILSEL